MNTAGSAQGIDLSSWQPPLTSAGGYDFVLVKATEGTSWVDPNFAANWDYLATQPVHRGAYHYFHPAQPAAQQAALFMSVVIGRGLLPGDMVAGDFEVTEGTQPGPLARQFLDLTAASASKAVAAASGRQTGGPHCPVLCYSYLDFLPNLADCIGYPLWVADYASTAPASVAPWKSWTFWQWSGGGGPHGADQDAYNGTAAGLDAWISTYTGGKPPVTPPPSWTEQLMQQLPTLQQTAAGDDVRTIQGTLIARGHRITVDGVFGQDTHSSVRAFQASKGLKPDGIVGPLTWAKLLNR